MADERAPSPWPGVVGGVICAVALVWLVSAVIGAFVAIVRLLLIVAALVIGLLAWSRLRRWGD